MLIGYHAAHEQFPPSRLLELVALAQQCGFASANCSDHFHPFGTAQGQSGFAWSWLGAALHATGIPFGVVCAPGQRYHPAIIAQAAATLCEMFGPRFWLAIGSGQLLNEGITGDCWPAKAIRRERLKQCAQIMRRLWAGEEVSFQGLITVRQATLYTRPKQPPLLIGAAVSEESAAAVAEWADGMLTVSHEPQQLLRVVQAFRDNGGRGKPVMLQAAISYHPDERQALRNAYEQWGSTVAGGLLTEIRTPQELDEIGGCAEPERMRSSVRISSDLKQHIEWLQRDAELGFEQILLHNVGLNQEQFIHDFAEHVLPQLA